MPELLPGKVEDDNGEPMTSVNGSVLNKPIDEEREQEGPRSRKAELSLVAVGVTDNKGEYRVYAPKPGEYYVKAVETGQSTSGQIVE